MHSFLTEKYCLVFKKKNRVLQDLSAHCHLNLSLFLIFILKIGYSRTIKANNMLLSFKKNAFQTRHSLKIVFQVKIHKMQVARDAVNNFHQWLEAEQQLEDKERGVILQPLGPAAVTWWLPSSLLCEYAVPSNHICRGSQGEKKLKKAFEKGTLTTVLDWKCFLLDRPVQIFTFYS